MESGAGGKAGLRVAIYDAPAVVGKRLAAALANAGHNVLFEGPLKQETARPDADLWITKWSSNLNWGFLQHVHPRIGLLTLSVGTDHIDKSVLAELKLKLETCPTYSSISVAEHALALALRCLHGECVLPPVSPEPESRPLVFANYSDNYAEQAVAQMVMRARQIESGIARSKRYDYERYDAPWSNDEMGGLRIGIVGQDRSTARLAKILKFGLNCELMGYDTGEELEAYGVRPIFLLDLLSVSDYVFLATDRHGMSNLSGSHTVDCERLASPYLQLSNSDAAILGTGRIGSVLARMLGIGFGCSLKAYSTTEKKDLVDLGVKYVPTVEAAISSAQAVFIALPLNDGTRNILGRGQLDGLSTGCSHTIVNVTRDAIIDSEALFQHLGRGSVMFYGTDVLPSDKTLWSREPPNEITVKFVQHRQVVATPHEGDCSRYSLERLCMEVLQKLESFREVF